MTLLTPGSLSSWVSTRSRVGRAPGRGFRRSHNQTVRGPDAHYTLDTLFPRRQTDPGPT